MAFEIKGTVKRIGAIETKGEKFTKRALIVDIEDGKYPQVCEFQATGDRCGLLDPLNVGDEVRITWNLRGREWTGNTGSPRVFNSLDIWKLEVTSKASVTSVPSGGGTQDDIPFASCEFSADPSAIAKVLR